MSSRPRSARSTLALGAASTLVLSACGLGACGAPAATGGVSTTPTVRDPAASTGAYEVHEWGLLRAMPGDVLSVGTIAPPLEHDLPMMVVEKPVLYFHGTGEAPITIEVASVHAIAGTIREHWPLDPGGAGDRASVSWGPLTISPERCALLAPADRAGPCGHLPDDEACEAVSLASTVTESAWCIDRGGDRTPLLFYRSTNRGVSAPLRASSTADGALEVAHVGTDPIPGSIVRFDEWPGGLTVTIATPPLPGETVRIEAGSAGADAARAAIDATMRELHLTTEEADAFLRAWDAELFAVPDVVEQPVAEEIVVERAFHRVSVLYFLPPALADEVARIELSPAPTAVHRALAVWTAPSSP